MQIHPSDIIRYWIERAEELNYYPKPKEKENQNGSTTSITRI